jgi:hypothetical protein
MCHKFFVITKSLLQILKQLQYGKKMVKTIYLIIYIHSCFNIIIKFQKQNCCNEIYSRNLI